MRAMKVATLALLAAFTFAPAEALAKPHGPAMADRGADAWAPIADRHMHRLMDQLKLTPEQRGKIETIRALNKEQTRPLREDQRKKRLELFALVRGAKATREQAIAKQREIDALHARLSESRLAAWFEARAVLTPEQLAQLEKLPAGRQGGAKGHGQRRGWGNR